MHRSYYNCHTNRTLHTSVVACNLYRMICLWFNCTLRTVCMYWCSWSRDKSVRDIRSMAKNVPRGELNLKASHYRLCRNCWAYCENEWMMCRINHSSKNYMLPYTVIWLSNSRMNNINNKWLLILNYSLREENVLRSAHDFSFQYLNILKLCFR